MPAPLGNEYYKIRTKDGKCAKLTPTELMEKANEYFKWCVENPMQEEQIVKYKEHYEKVNISKLRVYTLAGLCNFIDIAINTFRNYEQNKDYMPFITRIRQTIYQQKFEGASSGFFKENLIIRDLGIKDAQEISYNNQLKQLSKSEVQQLKEVFSSDYGKMPDQKVIDIDFEEID